jgi:MFS family permease
MVIKLNLNALRETSAHEYLIRFVLGGAITVIAGLLGSHYGPEIGGLFLAFPAIFPASATLLEKHEREKKREAGIAFTIRGRLAAALDARGAVMGALAGTLFALLVWKMLPKFPLWETLPLALVLWLVVATLFWYVRKHHPWSRPSQSGGKRRRERRSSHRRKTCGAHKSGRKAL